MSVPSDINSVRDDLRRAAEANILPPASVESRLWCASVNAQEAIAILRMEVAQLREGTIAYVNLSTALRKLTQ